MTSLPTTDPAPTPTFAEQEAAVLALAAMAAAFPHLPPAYIVVHTPGSGPALYIQLDAPGAFEAWREALNIASVAVDLVHNGESSRLRAEGAFSGSAVELYGWGLLPVAPRDPDARAAEQRHQLDDPATEAACAARAPGYAEACTPAVVS